MNHCPQCQRQRQADEYKCPACDCYYSQLDEILATEEAEVYKKSFKGRFQAILHANNSKQALQAEIKNLTTKTPLRTKFTLIVILLFIFAMTISVM